MIIFRTSLKRIFKSKVRFILLMLCPLIFIIMFTFQDHRAASIGIADKDGSTLSNSIYQVLKNSDGIKVIKIDEDQIYDLTASYVVDYSIIIDKGFERDIIDGGNPKIREYYVEDRQKLHFIRNSLQSEIDSYKLLAAAAGHDDSRFQEAFQKYKGSGLTVNTNLKRLNEAGRTRGSMGFLVQFMLYMAIITTGLILEDKVNGTFYRTFYSPVSVKKYFAENLAAFFVTAVIQSVGIILLLMIMFNMYMGSIPIAMIGLFVTFSLVCISLGLFITSILKKPMQAYITVAVLTTPLVMLGGCYWSFDFMPDIMNKIGKFIPLSWVMRTVDSVLNGSITPNTLFMNCGILVIFAAIFLAAGLMKKVDISR